MAQFDNCVDYVLRHEAGLIKQISDPGGITNYGISLRFLREVNSDTLKKIGIFEEVGEQSIIDLTEHQARRLYYSEFWVAAPFEKIINDILGQYIFDMAVQHGIAEATRITQRACNDAQKLKDYLKVDGIMGAKTIQAVNQASFMLIPALIAERSCFMRQLVALNPKLDVFWEGWMTRAFDI